MYWLKKMYLTPSHGEKLYSRLAPSTLRQLEEYDGELREALRLERLLKKRGRDTLDPRDLQENREMDEDPISEAPTDAESKKKDSSTKFPNPFKEFEENGTLEICIEDLCSADSLENLEQALKLGYDCTKDQAVYWLKKKYRAMTSHGERLYRRLVPRLMLRQLEATGDMFNEKLDDGVKVKAGKSLRAQAPQVEKGAPEIVPPAEHEHTHAYLSHTCLSSLRCR